MAKRVTQAMRDLCWKISQGMMNYTDPDMAKEAEELQSAGLLRQDGEFTPRGRRLVEKLADDEQGGDEP